MHEEREEERRPTCDRPTTRRIRVLICATEANKERETCDERLIEESDRREREKRE